MCVCTWARVRVCMCAHVVCGERLCDFAIVRVCVCVCACEHVTKKHEKRDLVLFPLPEGATGRPYCTLHGFCPS